jgi:hypothetical protein
MYGLAGISAPKAIYKYLKIITVIIKINTMATQNTMLNTLARRTPMFWGEYTTLTHGVVPHLE